MTDFLTIPTKAPSDFNTDQAKSDIKKISKQIGELQKTLYAQGKYSLLIILQGMDASGKDGLVSRVFKGINPLGCRVYPFKKPTEEEASHDFLWRIHHKMPPKGMIHIFNRSHYEDVLVPSVEQWIDSKRVQQRYEHINNFEKMLLEENNTIVLKFYLHISKEEQYNRLMERKTNPEKFWKHNDGDWSTREKWDQYMRAYQGIFNHCNLTPWHIIPSDENRYKEYLVAKKIFSTLQDLKLDYHK